MRYQVCLTMLLTLAASPLRADEGNDITRRSDFLTRSSHMDQEYRTVRDDIEKAGGLRDRFDAITAAMKTWLSAWEDLDNLTKNPPDTSLADLDQQIGIKLNSIDDSLHKIEAQAAALSFDLGSDADQLAVLGSINYRIESYDLGQQGQDAVERRLVELTALLRESSQNMANNLLAFRSALGVLRQAFSYRASAIWTARGVATLSEAMRTVDELFAAMDALQPIQDQLIHAIGSYQTAFSRYSMSEAYDNLVIVTQRCATLTSDVDQLAIAERYKTAAKARFAPFCKSFGLSYQRFVGHLAQAVASGIEHRKKRISQVCQSDQSQTMNCPLFSSVEAIKSTQILTFKEEALRNLEKLYTAIEDNRRRGNIFN